MVDVQAQIILSMISGDTTESGGTATFTITLVTASSPPLTIALSSSHLGESSLPMEANELPHIFARLLQSSVRRKLV